MNVCNVTRKLCHLCSSCAALTAVCKNTSVCVSVSVSVALIQLDSSTLHTSTELHTSLVNMLISETHATKPIRGTSISLSNSGPTEVHLNTLSVELILESIFTYAIMQVCNIKAYILICRCWMWVWMMGWRRFWRIWVDLWPPSWPTTQCYPGVWWYGAPVTRSQSGSAVNGPLGLAYYFCGIEVQSHCCDTLLIFVLIVLMICLNIKR